MATATKTNYVNRITGKAASKRRPLDSTWKPTKGRFIIALTFDDGTERAYVFLYTSLKQAEKEARWFVREDPYGDGIVAARVRRIVSVALDDPN